MRIKKKKLLNFVIFVLICFNDSIARGNNSITPGRSFLPSWYREIL